MKDSGRFCWPRTKTMASHCAGRENRMANKGTRAIDSICGIKAVNEELEARFSRSGSNAQEWGTSQSMPGVVVRDFEPHRPPTELWGAPGEGHRRPPPFASDPARRGWLHLFSALEFPRATGRGRGKSKLPWRRSLPPLATGWPRCPY
uniref:Uncharacterized protein n=1 Tax=Molossus molossus TaxID=27622 RepID=A0A7J8ERK6_MOLMO|nr:hypothetical protein HJG59_008775 [Molossus molossus]